MKKKLLVFLLIILCTNNINSNDIVNSKISNNNINENNIELIKNSLIKYESWIRDDYVNNLENLSGTGFPFYLTGFSELYRGLSIYVNNNYSIFLDKVLSYLIVMQNKWTWSSDDAGIHPHYNSHFAKNFYDAYLLTKNITYLSAFIHTVEAFDEFFDGEKIHISWGSNFYAYTQLVLGINNKILGNLTYYSIMANKLANYSISYYNYSTNEWYPGISASYPSGYIGRAAYYHLLALTWFLRYKDEILAFSPQTYFELMNITTNSINLITKYILNTGTFFYLDEIPDYTESASLILYGLSMIDKEFGFNHNNETTAALNTIINRQREDGAYYITNSSVVEIFYTDNIAQYAWHYIEFLESNLTKDSVLFIHTIFPFTLYAMYLFYKKNKKKIQK